MPHDLLQVTSTSSTPNALFGVDNGQLVRVPIGTPQVGNSVGRMIPLSAAEIASPTAQILADTTATYVGPSPDYVRYYSNGAALLQVSDAPGTVYNVVGLSMFQGGDSPSTADMDAAAVINDAILNAAILGNDFPTTRIVQLPTGYIPFATQLIIRQNTYLRGVWGMAGGTELWWRGADGVDAITNVDSVSSFTVEELRLFDKRTSPVAGIGIAISRAVNRIALRRLFVTNFPQEQVVVGAKVGQSGDNTEIDDIWLGGGQYAKGILINRLDNNTIIRNVKSDLTTAPANDGYTIRVSGIGSDNAAISIDSVKHESDNRCPTISIPSNSHGNISISNVIQRNPAGAAAGAGDVVQVGRSASASNFFYDSTTVNVTGDVTSGSFEVTGMSAADVRKCILGLVVTGTGIPASSQVFRQTANGFIFSNGTQTAATATNTGVTIAVSDTTGSGSENAGRLALFNLGGANHSDWTGATGAAVLRGVGSSTAVYGPVVMAQLGSNGRFQRTIAGNGAPLGVVYGNVGDIFSRLDSTSTTCGTWVKQSGNATNVGWASLTPNTQSVAFAASLSVNLQTGDRVIVGTLTGNLTHNSPTNMSLVGTLVSYEYTQDGTGGRTTTYSALHKGAWPTASGTANQKKTDFGQSDGTNIVFLGSSGWY